MTKPSVDEVEAMAVELIKEAAEYDESYMAEIAIVAAAMLRSLSVDAAQLAEARKDYQELLAEKAELAKALLAQRAQPQAGPLTITDGAPEPAREHHYFDGEKWTVVGAQPQAEPNEQTSASPPPAE
jgi:hypothetical protein